MRFTLRGAALVMAPLLLLLACGGGSESDAVVAVREFYSSLNEGRFEDAKGMYQAEMRDVFADPENAAGFESWADQETRQRTIAGLDVLEESVLDDGKAQIGFTVRYGDGSTKATRVDLALEEGSWKLGMIQ